MTGSCAGRGDVTVRLSVTRCQSEEVQRGEPKHLSELGRAANDTLLPRAQRVREHVARFRPAIAKYHAAWSRSNLAGHASMYYEDLKEPPPGRHWDAMRGLRFGSQSGWAARDTADVVSDIEREARSTLHALTAEVDELLKAMRSIQDQAVGLASVIAPDIRSRSGIDGRLAAVEAVRTTVPSAESLLRERLPGHILTQDHAALAAPRASAPHQNVDLTCEQAEIAAARAEELASLCGRLAAATGGLAPDAPRAVSSSSPPSPPQARPAAVDASAGRAEFVVQVVATIVLFASAAAGLTWLFDRSDRRVATDAGPLDAWVAARAGCAAGAVVMIALSASVVWFGVVQRRRDFLTLVLRSHLKTAAALAAAGALLTVFGIG